MKKHDCTLHQLAEERILYQVVETGLFIDLRRRFHGACMISVDHPMTAVYYKSITVRIHEEIRHLGNYRWMIHPYSILSLYWEFLIFIVYTTQLITYTVVAAKHVYFREATFIVLWKIALDYIMTIDIIKSFFTGYYDHIQNKTVLHSKTVAKKYLKGYFLIDLIACMHSYLVPIRMGKGVFVENTFLLAVTLKTLMGLRIFRVGRWMDAIELFRIYMDLSIFNRFFRAILLYMLIVIYLYTLFFEVEEVVVKNLMPLQDMKWSRHVIRSFYSATLILLHVNYGDRMSTHPYTVIVTVLFLAIGYCLQLLLYTLILQEWIQFSNARNKNESLFRQFTEYLNYKALPMALRKRFFSFYQFKYQNQYYNEMQINRMISKILRQEILVYVTKNHVQRVEFFHDLPDHVLIKIVAKLKSEIYLANDVIIKAGVTGTCMFFIYFGTVAIYAPSGKEVCHLEDGAHFGEIALLYNEPRVASVMAVTPCELFVLKRSDFSEALEPYPQIRENISKLAEERMRTIFYRK